MEGAISDFSCKIKEVLGFKLWALGFDGMIF